LLVQLVLLVAGFPEPRSRGSPAFHGAKAPHLRAPAGTMGAWNTGRRRRGPGRGHRSGSIPGERIEALETSSARPGKPRATALPRGGHAVSHARAPALLLLRVGLALGHARSGGCHREVNSRFP